ncbi:MAG: DinB family protein [Bacteroidia bacterium]|nr:DinB family protein [Bacteroidia bacterium]
MDILSGASIGMHFRHVIEFFDCVVDGVSNGMINYDLRKRNGVIEQDPLAASRRILELRNWIQEQHEDKALELQSDMCEGDTFLGSGVRSSYNRELIYAIEHAIHHMAIIKIAVINSFPDLQLEPNFGVAFSTVRYRESACAQ